MLAVLRRLKVLSLIMRHGPVQAHVLSNQLEVSDRTIRNDISVLSVLYPFETERGHYGYVKLPDDYSKDCLKILPEDFDYLVDNLKYLPEERQGVTALIYAKLAPPDTVY